MNTNIPKACREKWTEDLEEYLTLHLSLDFFDYKADPQGLDPVFGRINIAADKVLGQRAPSIDAIADKLMILWEDEIWFETNKATQMQIIIGDLRLFARSAK